MPKGATGLGKRRKFSGEWFTLEYVTGPGHYTDMKRFLDRVRAKGQQYRITEHKYKSWGVAKALWTRGWR